MAFDANLEFSAAANLNNSGVASSEIEIGRTGFPRNTCFTVIVPQSDADADLLVDIELTTDGSFAAAAATASIHTVGSVHFPPNSKGVRSISIEVPIPYEQYTDANIEARMVCRSTGVGDWGTVKGYLSDGKEAIWGRQDGADTLIELT